MATRTIHVANPNDRNYQNNRFIFAFGAYGDTLVMAWGDFQDALDEAGDWLREHAPGILHTEEVNEAYNVAYDEAVADGMDEDDATEHAQAESEMDMTPIGDSEWIASWEWTIVAENPTRSQILEIQGRAPFGREAALARASTRGAPDLRRRLARAFEPCRTGNDAPRERWVRSVRRARAVPHAFTTHRGKSRRGAPKMTPEQILKMSEQIDADRATTHAERRAYLGQIAALVIASGWAYVKVETFEPEHGYKLVAEKTIGRACSPSIVIEDPDGTVSYVYETGQSAKRARRVSCSRADLIEWAGERFGPPNPVIVPGDWHVST